MVQQLHGSHAGLGSELAVKLSPLSRETMANSLLDKKQAVTAPRSSAAMEKPSLGFRFKFRTGENAFAPGARLA